MFRLLLILGLLGVAKGTYLALGPAEDGLNRDSSEAAQRQRQVMKISA
jgi:hypothetical protein